MKSYEDLFGVRGAAYDLAMRRYPDARAAEFQQVVSRAKLQPGQRVADVPAGGGYLQAYLPDTVIWLGHEPCAGFHGELEKAVSVGQPALLPLPWSDHSVDAIISLAGIHHLDDKHALFAEFHRVAKPGGVLVLSDVATDSDNALFLDQFVGAHNSTGHQGAYLDQGTLDELAAAGWSVSSKEVVPFYWCFDRRVNMTDFCRQLFDLRNISDATLLQAIEQRLGVDVLASGRVGMKWSLMTITARKWE